MHRRILCDPAVRITAFIAAISAAGCSAAPPPAASAPEAPQASASETSFGNQAALQKSALPKQAAPVQGASRWAVYVATDKPGGPALMTASERAKSLGAELFIQEIGCDREHTPGVNAQDGHEHAAGAHFETEADAKRFATAFSPAPVWVGQVKTFCLDGGEGP